MQINYANKEADAYHMHGDGIVSKATQDVVRKCFHDDSRAHQTLSSDANSSLGVPLSRSS